MINHRVNTIVAILSYFGDQSNGELLRRYQLMINDPLRNHILHGGVWNREFALRHGPLKRPLDLSHLASEICRGRIKIDNNKHQRISLHKRAVKTPSCLHQLKLEQIRACETIGVCSWYSGIHHPKPNKERKE